MRRDIIDFDRAVVFEIVDGVDPASGAFLDRSARFMFLLSIFLRASKAPRRRRGSKVRAPVTAWTGRPGTRPEASASIRSRSPKPAASHWSRSTKASARSRSAEATLASRPRRSIFTGARLADRKVAPHERLRIKPLDDFLSDRAIGELHEREAARPSGFAIDGHDDVRWFTDGGEVRAEIRFGSPVRQVPDEQTDWQLIPRRPTILSQNGRGDRRGRRAIQTQRTPRGREI